MATLSEALTVRRPAGHVLTYTRLEVRIVVASARAAPLAPMSKAEFQADQRRRPHGRVMASGHDPRVRFSPGAWRHTGDRDDIAPSGSPRAYHVAEFGADGKTWEQRWDECAARAAEFEAAGINLGFGGAPEHRSDRPLNRSPIPASDQAHRARLRAL